MGERRGLLLVLALVLVIGGATLLYKHFDGSPTAPISAASNARDSNGASAGSADELRADDSIRKAYLGG